MKTRRPFSRFSTYLTIFLLIISQNSVLGFGRRNLRNLKS